MYEFIYSSAEHSINIGLVCITPLCMNSSTQVQNSINSSEIILGVGRTITRFYADT
jgi:hypothetical protein